MGYESHIGFIWDTWDGKSEIGIYYDLLLTTGEIILQCFPHSLLFDFSDGTTRCIEPSDVEGIRVSVRQCPLRS